MCDHIHKQLKQVTNFVDHQMTEERYHCNDCGDDVIFRQGGDVTSVTAWADCEVVYDDNSTMLHGVGQDVNAVPEGKTAVQIKLLAKIGSPIQSQTIDIPQNATPVFFLRTTVPIDDPESPTQRTSQKEYLIGYSLNGKRHFDVIDIPTGEVVAKDVIDDDPVSLQT